jgi:hypothetical protein
MGMNSNPFYLCNDPVFTSHKRYRDDYYNFSPNFSMGGLKPLTPLYASTPYNIPGYFMFNNNSNNMNLNNSSSNTATPKLLKSLIEDNKNNTFEISTIKSDSLNSSVVDDSNSNIKLNDIGGNKLEGSNLVLVPSAGNNVGFYTWVINGSPHPAVAMNNISNNLSDAVDNKKKIKIKKKKYMEESE